jgi:hypothetical protein
MQGYSMCRLGPSLTVHYNCKIEAYMQVYSKGSLGPSITVIIMAN